jgi:hypothetical protein
MMGAPTAMPMTDRTRKLMWWLFWIGLVLMPIYGIGLFLWLGIMVILAMHNWSQ